MLLRKCMYIIICTLWCSCLVRCATDKADAKEHDLEVFEEPYKMAVRYENLDDKEYAKEIVNKFISLLAKKDLMMVNDYVRKDSLYEKGWEWGNDVGVLKNELKHVQHKLEIAETKMNLHPYIESKEYDLLPHWLIRMTCSRRLKWVTALKFELTILAKNLAKRLRENNIDIEYFVTIIIKCIGVKADCHHEELTTWVAPTEKKWKVLAKELGFSSEESNYLWYIVEKTETKVKQIGKTVDYAWMYIGKLNPQSNYATVQNLIKKYLGEYAPRVLDTIHHVENKKFSGEVTVYLQPVTYREAIEIRKKVCEKLGRKQLLCSAYHGTKVFPEAVIQDEEFKDLTSEQPLVPPSEKSGEKELERLRKRFKLMLNYEKLTDKDYVKKAFGRFVQMLALEDIRAMEIQMDYGVSKHKLEDVELKPEIAKHRMNLQPCIEDKEHDHLFPDWLLRITCSRRVKWITGFTFKLTIPAKNLAQRLHKNKIEIEHFVEIIIQCFGVQADRHHKELTTCIATTEKKWEALGKELGFSSEESKYLWYIVEKTDTRGKKYVK